MAADLGRKTLDLPIITRLVIEELRALLREGLKPDHPVPFFVTRDGDFTRDLSDRMMFP